VKDLNSLIRPDGQSMTVTGRYHEAKYIQTVSHQILLGLDFLHGQEIIHCGKLGFSRLGATFTNLLFDLQPANIMFSAPGTLSDDFLQPPEFSSVRWLEEIERDNRAPQYLMASQRIRGNLDDAELSTILVKIGDLGGGNTLFPDCTGMIDLRRYSYVETSS
jgi:serine/threonine-protein kinase SRPK3